MTMTATNLNYESLDIEQIKKLIPHRYPMLMVDRIEKIQSDESAVGIKGVTVNEPFFQGHFPNYPVMPGVLIVEAMAQTAGVIVSKFLKSEDKEKLVYFMSIDEARFRKPVLPGHVLELHVTKIQNRRNVWKYKGEAKVDGVLHAEAIFTAMISVSEAK
ncbi:3-hydroxyacyl-ACP dehydratase FabZ [Candidatus Nucleicultrix amoebiphila]|uniref:3-hydroxyacyl-[acyl-carrier-protein] dehydratase FabZ n=2 Tax=Candidatus Nucleicultrix TaxID=1509243 RepID=A0A1W6N304_9PROT|nr:3-hydroxyacyl-ACP dehydratase [Candidatus Nucleicultrix amoebiphila FS5]